MSLILATGSNLDNKQENLAKALAELSKHFNFIAQSSIYTSKAVEYLNQPDFYNQVLEFEIPSITPQETIKLVLEIEQKFGRRRDVAKGPRTIDIDIIFWGLEKIHADNLTVPHPAWNQRSFVLNPLKELPFFQTIKQNFDIPTELDNSASPI